MADPLKTFFSPALVRRLAADLVAAHAPFPAAAFTRDATRGLDALELLDRGRHIASAMARHLPGDYPDAIDIVVRSLGPVHATDELLGLGMAPFFYLPHTLFIATHGLAHYDLSMRAQVEVTKRFSAEASVRPYIASDPERAWSYFRRWAADRDAHVRRLVSEGTRLRLPWAPRVPWLEQHPQRIVELLELLKDDPSTMVRRSVANNLNDLGRVHPALLLATATAWHRDATPERLALLEHALRGAVKRGDAKVLRLLGYGAAPRVKVTATTFTPRRVAIGGKVSIAVTLASATTRTQDLLVDMVVHFVKARGVTSPKVFKLGRYTLAPRQSLELSRSVSLAIHTTRVPHPGRHPVSLLVNGLELPLGAFTVVPGRPTRS